MRPRVNLASLPTPLEPLPTLMRELGGPEFYVKRDDLTGLAGGGNKVRKLEYLLADALAQKADTLVTVGGVQSNHARQTAAAAARCGFACHLILEDVVAGQSDAYHTSGNVLLDQLFGATIHRAELGNVDLATRSVLSSISQAGGRPYMIPVGGSTAIGALGYVKAAGEIGKQLDDRGIEGATLVLPTGSAGTHTGLLAGLHSLGRTESVLGIAVSGDRTAKENLVSQLTASTLELIGCDRPFDRKQVVVDDRYVGKGYGLPTPESIEAIGLLARTEGILLDPVYTGKAMAGLIDQIKRQSIEAQTVVFLHTGGWPALFAYPNSFSA